MTRRSHRALGAAAAAEVAEAVAAVVVAVAVVAVGEVPKKASRCRMRSWSQGKAWSHSGSSSE